MPWTPSIPFLRRGPRPRRFYGIPQKVFGGYLVAEGIAYVHHAYAMWRARHAPAPERVPADPEYGEKFLALARCDARKDAQAGPLACARFVRHAFYGVPPEALSRDAVQAWLQRHVGDAASAEEAITALEAALGPHAPSDVPGTGEDLDTPAFVYGEGPLKAWYKPLPMRIIIEGQRLLALRDLEAAGFQEYRDPRLPQLRYYARGTSAAAAAGGKDPAPLVVLHGYGRGLASPLFGKLIPELGLRPVVIVECPWLLVTRVPGNGDVTRIPAVREIAASVARFLENHLADEGSPSKPAQVDVLAHSFGTAVASALARELEERANSGGSRRRPSVAIRRAILMDPMCFLPGMTKQAQLLRRMPRDLAAELVEEAAPGAPTPSFREVVSTVLLNHPQPGWSPVDEASAATERRRWVIFQTYFFFYFIFRDLVYSWVNSRCLQGPEYLDRGYLRSLNRHGNLLTVLAETDTLIPAPLLRDDLSAEVPKGAPGGVLWLPTVGHGACQHRADVVERITSFLAA